MVIRVISPKYLFLGLLLNNGSDRVLPITIFFNETLCEKVKSAVRSALGLEGVGLSYATRIREEIKGIYKCLYVSYYKATE